MTNTKTLLSASLVALACAIGSAASAEEAFKFEAPLNDPGVEMQVEKDQIQEFEELTSPFTHGVTLQGRDGVAYISQNGRFILRGVIFDSWTGKTIQSIEELRDSKKTLNMAELGLKDEDLDPFYWGDGNREVTLFVDPLCPYCGQLFDQLLADPTYKRDYKFKILTVPFLGENSTDAVTKLSCAKDRDAALNALLTKDSRWLQTNPVPEGCEPETIIQRTILSQMLGVTGVPYIIGAEGGIARGMPQDLKQFLTEN